MKHCLLLICKFLALKLILHLADSLLIFFFIVLLSLFFLEPLTKSGILHHYLWIINTFTSFFHNSFIIARSTTQSIWLMHIQRILHPNRRWHGAVTHEFIRCEKSGLIVTFDHRASMRRKEICFFIHTSIFNIVEITVPTWHGSLADSANFSNLVGCPSTYSTSTLSCWFPICMCQKFWTCPCQNALLYGCQLLRHHIVRVEGSDTHLTSINVIII